MTASPFMQRVIAAVRRIPPGRVATYGDIFRIVPGMEVANYNQGGIGYGLSLHGFTNAEHGRDIAYFIEDVPVHQVSSTHTRNYADLNITAAAGRRALESRVTRAASTLCIENHRAPIGEIASQNQCF